MLGRLKLKSFLVAIVFFLLALFARNGWTQPFVYERAPGASVTFAWDHVGAAFTCAPVAGGTPVTHNFPRGTNGSFVCNSRTYQLTWNSNSATVPGYNADGSAWTGVYRYRYRGSLTPAGGQQAQVLAGEVVPNQAVLALAHPDGDLELEVQTIRTVGAVEQTSDWAKSTNPVYATVDGAARGWIVRIKTPEVPPVTEPPGAIKGMRLNP